ncbi:hypothetical protein BS329_10120 [Amycolatopsis coloradensis]|uniref:Uncharacterized protein n=1 Tax=Amycolatopsis coloradensis TaxID=76021 RepID=A0A1R0KVW6_9PSEU|nr:hypothetical protein BS329_10120 [Amycolatopsis coloradensis]
MIPTTGPFAVPRALRVPRVPRLISVVPSTRKVVTGLLSLIIFVAGVMTGEAVLNLFIAVVVSGMEDELRALRAEVSALRQR